MIIKEFISALFKYIRELFFVLEFCENNYFFLLNSLFEIYISVFHKTLLLWSL